MKVAIYGSLRNVNPDQHELFKQTCIDLGAELAKRGHIPLLHSEGKNTADLYVFQGLLKYAETSVSKPRVESHRALDVKRIYPNENAVSLEEILYPPNKKDTNKFSDKRLGPRVGTIAASDVVLLIGGSTGTRNSGIYARQLKKPILAIPCFGGSAEEIYKDFLENSYLQDERISSRIGEISQPSGSYPDAVILLLLCQALASQHTYFMSYHRKDSSVADHVEVMFRRENRHIRRDDRDLSISDHIKTELLEKMRKSDTFFCLWSKKSAASKWCQWERDMALKLVKEDGRLRRIVLITIDEKKLSKPWKKFLQLDGLTRKERVLAVQTLIKGEIKWK